VVIDRGGVVLVVALWRLYRAVVDHAGSGALPCVVVRRRVAFPLWNLFRPKQVVNDMWRLTSPDGSTSSVPMCERFVPRLDEMVIGGCPRRCRRAGLRQHRLGASDLDQCWTTRRSELCRP
jgi:hypothetical protein